MTFVILFITCVAVIIALLIPMVRENVAKTPMTYLLNVVRQRIFTPKPTGFTSLPTPAPIHPLPTGTQEYTFMFGKDVIGPKIQKVTINPLTPAKNGTQTVSVAIKNDSAVTRATATLYTDREQHAYELKLASGSATDGSWAASWKITDTYNYTYYLKFLLQSKTGDWTGGLTFR